MDIARLGLARLECARANAKGQSTPWNYATRPSLSVPAR
jgi:hypothetical protein